MIFLYSFVLVALGGLRWVVQRRAASLGRRYSALVRLVQQTLTAATMKPGNAGKFDPCVAAKAQYELGRLVQRRDAVEAKHYAWQARSDRLAGWLRWLRAWKGQTLPYTLGVADVWLALTIVDQLGVGDVLNTRQAVQTVVALFQGP
jgi:hypothetical protein